MVGVTRFEQPYSSGDVAARRSVRASFSYSRRDQYLRTLEIGPQSSARAQTAIWPARGNSLRLRRSRHGMAETPPTRPLRAGGDDVHGDQRWRTLCQRATHQYRLCRQCEDPFSDSSFGERNTGAGTISVYAFAPAHRLGAGGREAGRVGFGQPASRNGTANQREHGACTPA